MLPRASCGYHLRGPKTWKLWHQQQHAASSSQLWPLQAIIPRTNIPEKQLFLLWLSFQTNLCPALSHPTTPAVLQQLQKAGEVNWPLLSVDSPTLSRIQANIKVKNLAKRRFYLPGLTTSEEMELSSERESHS